MPRYIKEIFIISIAKVMNLTHVSLIHGGVTIQMKVSEQYSPVALFIKLWFQLLRWMKSWCVHLINVLYKMILTFESA